MVVYDPEDPYLSEYDVDDGKHLSLIPLISWFLIPARRIDHYYPFRLVSNYDLLPKMSDS